MESEEGEILEPGVSTPGEDYDPSYEWPGEISTTSLPYTDPLPTSKRTLATLRPNQPTFRLIVLRSSILSSKHRLGVIDGHSEIQFGRDVVPNGSTTPKIRLKEMQVSKLHATAYWDASRREWGVVDMGSMHGTFLKTSNATGDDHGTRLSPPRQASIPRKLSHMDQLTIGGTTRRALMPATQPDAPGVSTPPSSVSLEAPTPPPRLKSPSVEPTSQPAVPLPASNIGHRLLMKQGWEPGTALGSPLNSYEGQVGLVEPIEPMVSLNRGGLGIKRASTTSLPTLSDQDWKETGKRRRWDRT
ncbi:hypothetical protein C0993_010628 [Termitomyces sp. T159_Od127]|nr:hypothetical protein C0993_010628 [Termitomyces sp. T159_Od127]